MKNLLVLFIFLSGCGFSANSITSQTCYLPTQGVALGPSIQTLIGNSNPAAVVVTPPLPTEILGKVHLPDGTLLDVSGSKTAGIQEAIQYAADYGWDLLILGSPGGSTYHLSASLNFPSLQGKAIHFDEVTLDFGPEVTGSAITFDSTMMVDLKIVGEVHAPFAEVGVAFIPHSIVPLDGIIVQPGMTGNVDSRFRVQKITAGGAGAAFNMESGDMTNNSYYFGEVHAPRAVDNSCGPRTSKFESDSEITKTGALTPLPYDVFNPKAVVVNPTIYPMGNPGTVSTPEGPLDTSGTLTAGLQEAIDYAGVHTYPLVVYGRGLQLKYLDGLGNYPNNGFYQLNSGLKFPAMQNQFVKMFNVTLNYGSIGEPAILIQDAQNVDFEIMGQLVTPGATTGVTFKPTNGIGYSIFRIGHEPLAQTANFEFDASVAPILNSQFLFHEPAGSKYGIKIDPVQCFCFNYVRGMHVHTSSVTGVQVGNMTESNAHDNTFDIRINSDGQSQQTGMELWGWDNQIFLDQGNSETAVGINFGFVSVGNILTYSKLNSLIPIENLGINSAQIGTYFLLK